MRHTLTSLLLAAVAAVLAARLPAGCPPPGPGRRERPAVAVDGKAVRGTRHASGDGQAVHLLAAADPQASTVLAQAKVNGKTNEIAAACRYHARDATRTLATLGIGPA